MDTPLAVLVLGAHRPAPSRELKALISEQSRLPLLLSSSAVGLQAEPPHLHPMGGGLASQVKAQSRNTTAAASYRRMQVTAARQQEILTSEHPHYYIYLYIFFLHRFQKSKLNKRSFHCRWAPGAPTWASLCYRSSTPCQNGPKVPQNAVKCQGSSQHLACFGGRRGRTTVSKRHFHKIHSFGGGGWNLDASHALLQTPWISRQPSALLRGICHGVGGNEHVESKGPHSWEQNRAGMRCP